MALTYGQLKDALKAEIVASLPDGDNEMHYVWVCDFSDTFVVYEINDECLQDDYTIDTDDKITLAGKPEPVKAVTTFEPLGSEPPEVRSVSAGSHVEMFAQSPARVAQIVAERISTLSNESVSSDLIYSPYGPHSYYRDLISRERGVDGARAAESRLTAHAEQMGKLAEMRQKEIWRRFGGSALEYRVTPDRTDGTGGYFSPPAWLNELFATANRPGRVLAGLMARFPLPPGVSSVNVPVVGTGSLAQSAVDNTAVADQDITDSASSSQVVPFAGQVDVALQLLEQSPHGAHLDWAIFMDLTEGYDYDLETQLLVGAGSGSTELLGVTKAEGIVTVPYTSVSPTGSKMWPFLSQVPAQIAKGRRRPPECWLMNTSRWAWLQGAEDTAERPFGLCPMFIGKDDPSTPDPIGGLMGWPVFLNEAIPTNLGNGKQDEIVCLRPSDTILLEGTPQTLVAREPLSGSLGVRLRLHANAAALTGRRPTGIGVLNGTGMTIQAGY